MHDANRDFTILKILILSIEEKGILKAVDRKIFQI